MSGGTVRITVPAAADGARLDRFLAEAIDGPTRSALRRLILEGRVRIDGRPAAKPGVGVAPGMHLEIDLPDPAPESLVPEHVPFTIIFEDEHLAVVDKPAGVVVHPGHGRPTGTLVHGLLARGVPLAPAGGARRPGIVHRLDRGTSGLLVVAKTDAAHRMLAAAFAARQIRKTYLAIVWGHPKPADGRIERSIGRSRADPTRMSVRAPRGRSAATVYRTLEAVPGFALLEVAIETGRTHQIRVHLQSIHHPVVGDDRYGGPAWRGLRDPRQRKAVRGLERHALHAWKLAFTHPATGETVAFAAPPPPEIDALLGALRGPA